MGLLKQAGARMIARMPDWSSSTVMILLSSSVGLLVLLLAMVIGISRRLARLERALTEWAANHEVAEVSPTQAETSAGGAFETFLKEDPARRTKPKSEQFAEYRRWRQENGLNWTNS